MPCGLQQIIPIGLLPPVALFELVFEVERRLFVGCGTHPFGGLAGLVESQWCTPILADAAVVADVEAYIALDFRVDEPVAALHAEEHAVKPCLTPAEFATVVSDSRYV